MQQIIKGSINAIASNCIMTELNSSTTLLPLNTVCRFIRNDEKNDEFKLSDECIYIACNNNSIKVNNYLEAKTEDITYIVEINDYTRHSYKYIHWYLKVVSFIVNDIDSLMGFTITDEYSTRDYHHFYDIADCLYCMRKLMLKL